MKNCNSRNIDWHKLSTVEYASALEVYGLARQFDNQPKMQRAILEHTLDEYRHAELFNEIARTESPCTDTSITIHQLIEWGGISPDNTKIPALIKSIVLFLQGEKRAETFLKGLKQTATKAEYREKIDLVLADELGHVSGIEGFLKHHGRYGVLRHQFTFFIRSLGERVFRNSKLAHLQKKSFGFLTMIVLRFPIEKFALTEDTSIRSLQKSIEDASRMS